MIHHAITSSGVVNDATQCFSATVASPPRPQRVAALLIGTAEQHERAIVRLDLD